MVQPHLARLKPWPDSVPGLTRIKRKYIIATLSNGTVRLLTDMAKHCGLPWDTVLGSDIVRHYKPDAEMYQSAIEFLGSARTSRAGINFIHSKSRHRHNGLVLRFKISLAIRWMASSVPFVRITSAGSIPR